MILSFITKRVINYLILLLFFSPLSHAEQRLNYPGAIGTISAKFNATPRAKQEQNELNTISNVLVSIVATENNIVTHGIGESKKTDGSLVSGLGSDYPQRVAAGISGEKKFIASVRESSGEQGEKGNEHIVFSLNLTYKGLRGIGYYWAAVKNGITYQASTWCVGEKSINCIELHNEFINTVRY